MGTLVDQLLKTSEIQDMEKKHMDFRMDFQSVADEMVFADELRLKQVLLNLLSNAVKYTNPGGEIRFCVQQKKRSARGYAKFEFRVKDNGFGISRPFRRSCSSPFPGSKRSRSAAFRAPVWASQSRKI